MSVHRAQTRVLVVGGGIAGLSCALAFRTHGFVVDVVERSGTVSADTVTLTGRCVDALADLAVLASCKSRGHATGSVYRNVFDATGMPTNAGAPQVPHSAMPPTLIIQRPALIDILTKAAEEAGVRLRVPCVARTITQDSAQVTVTFDDDSTATYGLVVGADGIRSTVRGLLWGFDVEPTPAGAIGIEWTAAGLPAGEPGLYYGPGNVVSISKLAGDVIRVGTFVETTSATADVDGRDLLRDVLDDYSAPNLCALRDRLDETQDVVVRPWEWVFAPEWTCGRVVLIGDAAHATTHWLPAGAGMALIDAVVLAEECAEADDVPSGLAAYVARRWDRAQVVVQASVDAMRLRRTGDHATARVIVNRALKALVGPY